MERVNENFRGDAIHDNHNGEHAGDTEEMDVVSAETISSEELIRRQREEQSGQHELEIARSEMKLLDAERIRVAENKVRTGNEMYSLRGALTEFSKKAHPEAYERTLASAFEAILGKSQSEIKVMTANEEIHHSILYQLREHFNSRVGTLTEPQKKVLDTLHEYFGFEPKENDRENPLQKAA